MVTLVQRPQMEVHVLHGWNIRPPPLIVLRVSPVLASVVVAMLGVGDACMGDVQQDELVPVLSVRTVAKIASPHDDVIPQFLSTVKGSPLSTW